ncbi:MAG TPA: tetratricopeptide repeat protein [Terriglobia bacterium]|nr:tetratricopeptide repeat protein [Terriglobia bacterium]
MSRHELKSDEFVSTVQAAEDFFKQNARQIIVGVAAALVVIGGVVGWRTYSERQDASANFALAQALKTYQAEVTPAPAPNLFSSDAATPPVPAGQFTSADAKYKAALSRFTDVVAQYPHQKAADFARYHIGLCQAALGNSAAAIATLQAASQSSDKEAGALAGMALAGELAKAGKTNEAAQEYQKLADHATSTVPRATALLALADLYRGTKPAQARVIYQQLQKEFSSDSYLLATVKQQLDSLPK